jgi:hypothetical protein
MALLMQRLLKEMKNVTAEQIAATEPSEEPSEQEMFIALMPQSIRLMKTVLNGHLDDLRNLTRWHILDTVEDEVTRLRRYVDFINSALIYELEELVPEIAKLRRQGSLITFRRNWQVCAIEGALRPDEGIATDVAAEYVAELILQKETADRNDDLSEKPPEPDDRVESNPLENDAPTENEDVKSFDWLGSGDTTFDMHKMGWIDRAISVVQENHKKDSPDDSDDDISDFDFD